MQALLARDGGREKKSAGAQGRERQKCFGQESLRNPRCESRKVRRAWTDQMVTNLVRVDNSGGVSLLSL